jgi:hypothetical protein
MMFLDESVQNTFHVHNNGCGTLDDDTVIDEIEARLDSAYNGLESTMHQDLQQVDMLLFNVSTKEPIGVGTWATFSGGEKATDPLPPQDSALVLFNTKSNKSQGRKYLGVFSEDATTSGGRVSGNLLTDLATWAAVLIAPWIVGTGSLEFGNWSEDKQRFAEWVSVTIHDVWRTQRRRQFGVGI